MLTSPTWQMQRSQSAHAIRSTGQTLQSWPAPAHAGPPNTTNDHPEEYLSLNGVMENQGPSTEPQRVLVSKGEE